MRDACELWNTSTLFDRDQIEQQLATGSVKRHEAELVNDGHAHTEKLLLHSDELSAAAGFNWLAHEIGGPAKEHALFPFRRFDAESEIGFAGTDRAGADGTVGRRFVETRPSAWPYLPISCS